ncbi:MULTISPECIES: hypothetical protein [unclassified Thiocapsa]|uniref:hypothetical protein n=1 Tax=unclassified Thiocapsa TaxID=2641286 RepID=UPI0035ADA1B1
MKYTVVFILLVVSFSVYANEKELYYSYDVANWKLQLSSSVDLEHSIQGELNSENKDPGFRNEIDIYSACDRRRIVLDQLENPPGLDNKSRQSGKILVRLLMGSGQYDLDYGGMGQGSQAFDLPYGIWKALKSAKWAKLSYIGKDETPVEIRLDMGHLPLLMETVDSACN